VSAADEPHLEFASVASWEEWLAANHSSASGLWVRIARAGSGIPSPTHAEVLEVALSYGWIDAQKGRGDETHWVQRFMPRTKRSKWSTINRENAEALIASGRMKPAGLAEVERAKADGRWDAAYDPPSRITVPADLQEALDAASPSAREFFDGLSSQNRYAILYRVNDAKRPATRAARIEKFVAMCERGETLH
jgi:uncharacterized protein YdeI (YjbR/CyaY-like superfamily)